MKYHTDKMMSIHNFIRTIENSYIPHCKIKTFHMLLGIEIGDIRVRVVFDKKKKQKHNPKLSNNPVLNQKVTMCLFVRSTTKISTICAWLDHTSK